MPPRRSQRIANQRELRPLIIEPVVENVESQNDGSFKHCQGLECTSTTDTAAVPQANQSVTESNVGNESTDLILTSYQRELRDAATVAYSLWPQPGDDEQTYITRAQIADPNLPHKVVLERWNLLKGITAIANQETHPLFPRVGDDLQLYVERVQELKPTTPTIVLQDCWHDLETIIERRKAAAPHLFNPEPLPYIDEPGMGNMPWPSQLPDPQWAPELTVFDESAGERRPITPGTFNWPINWPPPATPVVAAPPPMLPVGPSMLNWQNMPHSGSLQPVNQSWGFSLPGPPQPAAMSSTIQPHNHPAPVEELPSPDLDKEGYYIYADRARQLLGPRFSNEVARQRWQLATDGVRPHAEAELPPPDPDVETFFGYSERMRKFLGPQFSRDRVRARWDNCRRPTMLIGSSRNDDRKAKEKLQP